MEPAITVGSEAGPRVACVGVPVRGGEISSLRTAEGTIVVEAVSLERFDAYLEASATEPPATVILGGEGARERVAKLRARAEYNRTRVFVLGSEPADLAWDPLDVEDSLEDEALGAEELGELVERGLRAHRALGANPLVPKYYLDAKYQSVIDWFENTRWNWSDIDLSQVRPELVSDDEVTMIKEAAIGEFGTLPASHNFLREWGDEYSFSSWSVAWGAEESRHALILSRYLKRLGVDTLAKHAMYKREPYPIGYNRAATLMMNVISESRVSEYYRDMAAVAQEPVLKRIWQHLSHDEGRHCRAFAVFCGELCELDKANRVAALEMAYVFLADREDGVKHPTGLFYPHSPSVKGIRRIESYVSGQVGDDATSRADARALAILRKLTGDPSLDSVNALRRKLRELM